MQLLYFIIVNIFAGIFQGIVGFGQGLVATPLSLTFLPKEVVFTGMIVAGIILNSFLITKVKEPLERDTFKPLLISTLIGMPIGVIVLRLIPINSLRILAGSVSVILTMALVFTKIHPHKRPRLVPVAGVAAGILQTSTNMPGPLVVLLLTSSGLPKDRMRKLLVTYFLVISVVTLPLYFLGGIISWRGVVFGLLTAPFTITAGYIGNRTAVHIPQHWYKTIALVTVTLSGAYAIYSGLH